MIDELKRHLQSFFQDGLVTVVGLGHSASLGLPTMPTLAATLQTEMPKLVDGDECSAWEQVDGALTEGMGLEPALDLIAKESSVTTKIVTVTASAIASAEAGAIESISRQPGQFALARLMANIGFTGRVQPRVVTTNYDRLVEIAAEIAGLMVDTGFLGAHHGTYDPKQSREALRSSLVKRGGVYRSTYRRHLVLAKPHGSLDWYLGAAGPIRSPYLLDLPRLMIPPGEGKYLSGYQQPFDHHIGLANDLIDGARAVLAIGFGFNDPHLQTHLVPRIEAGLPTLILTHTLTPAARNLLGFTGVTGIEAIEGGGSLVHRPGGSEEQVGSEIWQLSDFLREVLNE